jgi:hypothetical protein
MAEDPYVYPGAGTLRTVQIAKPNAFYARPAKSKRRISPSRRARCSSS